MSLELEILHGTRAFPKTQELFEGTPISVFFSNPVQCTWYGSEVSPYRGAFCVVGEGEGLSDLVGEFVQLTYKQERTITLYCLAETPLIEVPLAISRRAWLEIERLSLDEIFVYTQILR
jgi:hypothetical protein